MPRYPNREDTEVNILANFTDDQPQHIKRKLLDLLKTGFEEGWPAVKEGATEIPNAVLTNAQLSTQARVLYGVLKLFATDDPEGGQSATLNRSVLAHFIDRSERSVTGTLNELEKAGLIQIEANHSVKKPARYLLKGV